MLTQEGKALAITGSGEDGVIRDINGASIRIDNVQISFSKKHGSGNGRTATIEYVSDGKVVAYTKFDNFYMSDTIYLGGQGMRLPVKFTW